MHGTDLPSHGQIIHSRTHFGTEEILFPTSHTMNKGLYIRKLVLSITYVSITYVKINPWAPKWWLARLLATSLWQGYPQPRLTLYPFYHNPSMSQAPHEAINADVTSGEAGMLSATRLYPYQLHAPLWQASAIKIKPRRDSPTFLMAQGPSSTCM